MIQAHTHAVLQMSKHAANCKYVGAGGMVPSFRIEQETKSKSIRYVKQLKCAGCGYSVDYNWSK